MRPDSIAPDIAKHISFLEERGVTVSDVRTSECNGTLNYAVSSTGILGEIPPRDERAATFHVVVFKIDYSTIPYDENIVYVGVPSCLVERTMAYDALTGQFVLQFDRELR